MIFIDKITIISKSCNNYPQNLLSLSDSPELLFAIGNLSLVNTFSLAIVGSRNFTLESKSLTSNLVKNLVAQDITIISGMARGIDSIAHETCIENGGNTIAIIGGGFLYTSNKKLFNKILKNNGLILSEYFPDTPSYKSNFPQRNRLISGISDGVIIPQAGLKSGSLITATHALKQNKPLFTFPWNMDNENYFGNNLLLTQGAKCILSYKDVLKNYPNLQEKNFKPAASASITEEFKNIYSKITYAPIHINQLALKLQINLSELQYKLTLMELDDLIIKLPNNYISKK